MQPERHEREAGAPPRPVQAARRAPKAYTARNMAENGVTVAILSPHFDDAVLSCWHLLDGGGEVAVVTVFADEPPADTALTDWDRITGATDSRERVRERRREDERALAAVRRPTTWLPFLDAQFREGPADDGAIEAALERIAADVLHAPAGIGHSDHRVVRDVALRLSRAVSFYADLPYATEFGWPPWVTGGEPNAYLDVDAAWDTGVAPFRAAGYSARAVELTEAQQRRKAAAMREYRTQFPALEGGPQRRLTHPDLIRWEVVWERPTA